MHQVRVQRENRKPLFIQGEVLEGNKTELPEIKSTHEIRNKWFLYFKTINTIILTYILKNKHIKFVEKVA